MSRCRHRADRKFGFNTALYTTETTPAGEVGYGRAVGANVQRYTIHWRPLQTTATAPTFPNQGRPLGETPDPSKLLRLRRGSTSS